MTVTIDRPPPGPPPAGPPGPSAGGGRFNLEKLQESRAARALMGVLLAAIVLGVIWLILLTFTGHFTRIDKVKAELPAGSNAVGISAPVEYRHVTVGKVGSEAPGPGGRIAVDLEIYPKYLPVIPKGVEAEVEPLSIFGNQYVNLVPPAAPSGGHLRRTDFVAAYAGAPSSSLQGSVTNLYDLLTAIHPAELDTALTNFAAALDGQGQKLGQALADTSDYLKAVVPRLPTAQSDVKLLGRANQVLDRAAPDVVGTIANSSVTARTLTADQQALRAMLSSGASSVGQFAGILSQVQTAMPSLLNESGPLLRDVTQSPTELAETLSGLTQFASAVAANETQGPYLSVNTGLPVANISAGVNAALGYDNPASLDTALGDTVNPPTYTSANCPEYPGETNPYCGTGGSPDAQPVPSPPGDPQPLAVPSARSGAAATRHHGTTTAPAAPGTAPAAPSGSGGPTAAMMAGASGDPYLAELDAVQAVAAGLDGGRPPPAPGFADVVLFPLLSSMASP